MKNSTIYTKLLFFISLLGLCFSSTVHAEEKHTNVIPVNITTWSEDKNTPDQKLNPLLTTKSAEIQLYHNNGNPIKTNILESSPKTNLYLFAVSNYYINKISYRDYYFSEAKTENIEAIQKESIRTLEKNAHSTAYTTESFQAIRSYHYSLYSGAKLTSTITFSQDSSDADINGKIGSVWDITASHTLKNTVINPPFISWNTQLSVPYSSQKLINYEPDSTMLPLFLFRNLTGFSINSNSSLSENYGSWTLEKNLFNPVPKTAQMNTKIRTSNTVGNLGLQLSHTYVRAGGTTHSTGIISTYIPDR
ncbi:hypothetical protein P4U05_20310 [Bacillus paranthracis]|uniref:hypothetical protein n=1 Tax=Bacillus paranthracis TaxID=2026186 RepID=UPI000200F9AD|nr:hypothetical protein [Bacillus paranthracis]ADY23923.1 hypothetical protein YBT020_23475 [Bacillus thuringiensis serovar finitimus YBT-020]MRC73952.1 hypothetical protein [Bacillus thuringiensis]OTX77357.1 hypothetical protein BK722_02165 [Bacillus thuringiensis serovar finitimus]MCR6795927.1 hypothetical protein [Bacillus paranthracis]MEC3360578.1 hypothetical protein [Bacillus paranthracis]